MSFSYLTMNECYNFKEIIEDKEMTKQRPKGIKLY